MKYIMHGSLGFMINNCQTQRAELKEKGGYFSTVNPRLTCVMDYILQPDWSLLLLLNIHGIFLLYTMLLVVCEQNLTTSCQYIYARWYLPVIIET